MNKVLVIFIIYLSISGCRTVSSEQPESPDITTNAYDFNINDSTVTRITFGSCSKQNVKDQRWDEILKNNPDLWIWLGDNIYGDTHDMNVMKEKYDQQKNHAGYRRLLYSETDIIGTWDDHDYGVNDGGKNYAKKKESKDLMLGFLDVDNDNPVYQREGVYQSYTYDYNNHEIKVILLDTRYFRDTIYRDPATRAYLPNKTGDILGEDQWIWLEDELKNSRAELFFIGSSIQVIPKEHAFEKWANFPVARQRLFDLLKKYPDKKVVLLSGDRHIAEISVLDLEGLNYPLYDFTSSGLTHAYTGAGEELNQYRVSQLIKTLNFGLILINWKDQGPEIMFEIRGKGNEVLDRVKAELWK